jgi:hypothetical protein
MTYVDDFFTCIFTLPLITYIHRSAWPQSW